MEKHRLFEIIYYLLRKKKTTALTLANRLEVSVRTIYRDINTLSTAGIPIYTESGKGGGIFLAEDYVLDKTLLSSDEQKLIMSSLLGINSMVDVIDQRLLLKLRAIFAYADESYLCVDFSRWGNNTDKTKYPLIKEAILSKYSLKLTYINRYNSTQTRVVKPIKLCFKSRGWYLLAEDDKDKKQKYFKLTRMLQLELGEKLNHIPQLAIDAATAPDYPEITITFDKSVLYRVYDEFDGSLISDNGDCVVVSVNMPVDDWLYGYLLSFCGKVIDVKPGYIMDNVKRLIHTMQYQYQSD